MTAIAVAAAGAAGCGEDEIIGRDPGGGSRGLLVRAELEREGDGAATMAAAAVTVQRGGVAVLDADVFLETPGGEVGVPHVGGGLYRVTVDGWRGLHGLCVYAGEDYLDGAIAVPDVPEIVSPGPTEIVDPARAHGGAVRVAWAGERGDRIVAEMRDFAYDGKDQGGVDVPAIYWTDAEQVLRVTRENGVHLAGGVEGSVLIARARAERRIFVKTE